MANALDGIEKVTAITIAVSPVKTRNESFQVWRIAFMKKAGVGSGHTEGLYIRGME
jgi:hypothetical protein